MRHIYSLPYNKVRNTFNLHFNKFDLIAFIIIFTVLMLLGWTLPGVLKPISALTSTSISTDPSELPYYAMRTVLRIFIALIFSLTFSISYAVIAAKNKRAEEIMMPMLDILQSVPVLGYISFTVVGFLALFPGQTLGVECAAIFAVFTAQAWNMTFSVYQSLKSIPPEIHEAAYILKLSSWRKFWQIEFPFTIPQLVWNTMMSTSGSWFFIVASESINVGETKYALPGIGSYIASAISEKNLHAILYAIIAMISVIIVYDQLFFRPLIEWSNKFKNEDMSSETRTHSWSYALFSKAHVIFKIFKPFNSLYQYMIGIRFLNKPQTKSPLNNSQIPLKTSKIDYLWRGFLVLCILTFLFQTILFLNNVGWDLVWKVIQYATFTTIRVITLIFLASIIWVPIAIYIGLNKKLTDCIQPLSQFLAAFPSNLLFPLAVIIITRYNLSPDIWLSPLMIFGTQWYIVFNVIAGASTIPTDIKETAKIFHIKNILWLRKVMLPYIFPYFITGAITAAGGCWNASIVAELVTWGNTTLSAKGIGAYIDQMTTQGNYNGIILGIGIMSGFVIILNIILWQPLYNLAITKLRQ